MPAYSLFCWPSGRPTARAAMSRLQGRKRGFEFFRAAPGFGLRAPDQHPQAHPENRL